jgi:hypothetical protein
VKSQNFLNTSEHTGKISAALSHCFYGAGDGDRTRDIQLGKFPLRVSTIGSICEVIEKTALFGLVPQMPQRQKSVLTFESDRVLWMFLWMSAARGRRPAAKRVQ